MSNRFPRPICILAFFVSFALPLKAQITANFNATPTEGCAPLLVSFSDLSTGNPSGWKWDLGNSTISYLQNPSVTYFNPGEYSVKLVVQNAGGKDSLIKTAYIKVYAAPQVSFDAPVTSGCSPLPVNFNNTSTAGNGTISSYLWDFGDGNTSVQQVPSHSYSNPGNYNISLVAVNSYGCRSTNYATNYITVNPSPEAGFNSINAIGCTAPHSVSFQNQSTGTGSLTYSWNFGDGNSSTLQNPVHQYNSNGIFNVTLITTNATGCKDTLVKNQEVHIGSLHPDFQVNPVCEGVPAQFTNISSPASDSVRWNFGDGTTSQVNNPLKTFVAGTYQVKMLAYFSQCKDSVIKTINVAPKPHANFAGNDTVGCMAPLSVQFTNNSVQAVSYQWDFGDGNTSSLPSPLHVYNSPGFYTVTLIVSNAAGCTDTLVKTEYIKIKLPEVTINNLPQRGCAPFSWTFSVTTNTLVPVTGYEWNFGDGSTSNLPNPTHVFAEGTYNIQLIITTASGCKDTTIVPTGIIASVKPQAAFSANPRDVCAFTAVNFTDGTTGTVDQWIWSFGDGGGSTAQHPQHEYQDTGYFPVTLIAGNNGCYDTIRIPNYIHVKPPIANFLTQMNCDQSFVRLFINSSIGADEVLWNFGDGTTSVETNPSHTYAAAGIYTVTLTVKNNSSGCTHSKTAQVIIADEEAAFTASKTVVCKRESILFTASQRNVNGIVSYNWNFGDGTTASGQLVNKAYSNSGNYSIRLIITDAAGCRDTLIKPLHIRVNGPTANFNASVPGSCLLTDVYFNDLSTTDGINGITQWNWNFGDGSNTSFTAPPFTHSYSNAGTYNVTLSITDMAGCTDTKTKNNHLIISRPVAAFRTTDTLSCPGAGIIFSNQSTGNTLQYNWQFGDGGVSSTANPVHTYTTTGLYTIKLTVTDKFGCTSVLIKENYVRIVKPIADFTVSDSVGTCPPLIVNFQNNSSNYQSFRWDFGDGTFSTAANPTHFYNQAGTYNAKLTITGPGGCTEEKIHRIIVKGPSGSFTYSNISGCRPLTVQFVAHTQNRSSFIWDFNDGTTVATNDSVISHTYTEPGIYLPKMILKNTAGCTVPITGNDTIFVRAVNASFTAGRRLLCDNGIISFTNTTVSNDVISSYKWYFGDGTTSTQIHPQHNYTNTGFYTVSLKVTTAMGCTDSVSIPQTIKIVGSPQVSITTGAPGCVPLTASISGNLLNADTSAIHWEWNISDGQTATGKTPAALNFLNSGVFNIRLIATNSSGCSDTALSSIEGYAIPLVNAGADLFICKGSGKQLNATGAATYTWSPAAGLSCSNCANPLANPQNNTQYIVTGKSVKGCVARDTIAVDVQFPFKMQVSKGDTLCVGESTTLSASGAHTYSWSPSAGLNSTTTAMVKATPTATTRYRVTGKDDKGCFEDTAWFDVKVYPIPTVDAGDDIILNVGRTARITPRISADVTSVLWTPSTGIVSSIYPGVEVKPTSTTDYVVTVKNPGGCMAADQVRVQVLCNNANVFIPNTFSPNGDGSNEIFYPRGTGLFRIKSARIFNRWGEVVFEKNNFKANDAGSGWDGKYKGSALNSDVFVYVLEIVCENNETIVYKGDVALIR